MLRFSQWLEAKIEFEEGDEFTVSVDKRYIDQPYLTIPGWGFIKLFYTGRGIYPDKTYFWQVHMIKGDKPGAGTLLYFAALMWVLTDGENLLRSLRPKHDVTHGWLASDTSLSLNALRARKRMEQQYGDYLYIEKHPDEESILINKGEGTWRRKAEAGEATMWRLKKTPPFTFKFI